MNNLQPENGAAAVAAASDVAGTADPVVDPWVLAASAAALLAVDPAGLGGLALRAGAGPVRDRWVQQLRRLLPAEQRVRRMPCQIADDRLLGGLDLAATLAQGRPVAQRGLLAETDGGLLLLPMAERLPPGTAARLATVLDEGEVGFERDGLGARWPARVALIAFDEGGADDDALAPGLMDRLAFDIDLESVALRDAGAAVADGDDVQAARTLLPRVRIDDAVLQSICATAWQLGVDSPRASLLTLRAARAAAALRGASAVTDDDAMLAVRLVLAPRATRLPAAERESQPAPEPRPETPPESPTEPPPGPPPAPPSDPAPAPEPDNAEPSASDSPETTPPADPEPASASAQALEDRLVEAAVSALPAQLLAALRDHSHSTNAQAGRIGVLAASARSGRPMGARRGLPKGGARLALVETLRAAAPWQRLRQAERPKPAGRLHVQADDLRVARLQQRAATATLFLIDASGSSALHRLAEAKGAINLLLADCYVRRDQVAVIAFRGRTAEVLLPPTRSLVRAKRSLAALPGGGGTPLAAGLEAALRLSLQVRRSGAAPVLVLLTDGRANIARDGSPGRAQAGADAIAMARQLRTAGLSTLVIDTSPQPADAARQLAAALGGAYRALPHAGSAALSEAVRRMPGR